MVVVPFEAAAVAGGLQRGEGSREGQMLLQRLLTAREQEKSASEACRVSNGSRLIRRVERKTKTRENPRKVSNRQVSRQTGGSALPSKKRLGMHFCRQKECPEGGPGFVSVSPAHRELVELGSCEREFASRRDSQCLQLQVQQQGVVVKNRVGGREVPWTP